MNQRRFYLSFFITSFVLYLYVTLFPRFARPIFHSINPTVFTKETEERVDNIKEFIQSKSFEKLSFIERKDLVTNYLFRESKKTYDCVKKVNSTKKCFSFKEDVIYTKKIYKEEDMVMRYPHQYNVIINNPHACDSNPELIIGTPVGPRQFLERMGTRLSWGNVTNVNGIHIKHLFFAGQDENDPEGDRMLREESDYYHDIVQFDMKNHFMNLTLLAILTYNWTDHYCPSIRYYARADNDMWFNPYKFVTEFLVKNRTNSLMGVLIKTGKPIRVSVSRYYLSKNVFPQNYFDPYVSGCFLSMSRDVLPMIVKGCEEIGPIIYFDDVFLGQIAAKRNISIVPYPGGRVFFEPRSFSGKFYKNIWAIHRFSPVDNLAMWQLANFYSVSIKHSNATPKNQYHHHRIQNDGQ